MSIDHLLKTNQNALLSVYDKTGIAEFAKGLHELGWNIISSGGTAKVVAEAGVPVTDVAELVGGEAILGHRVVTLSREIHSGLLADAEKPEDLAELKERGIPFIDLVAVDMYPLEEEIASGTATLQSVIEKPISVVRPCCEPEQKPGALCYLALTNEVKCYRPG
ncbi:hypothetical protein IPL68_05810 [Candidatus Saccharibacteria bacterium]|nr:MAG: hypothetical protein IPL68_05810 [Candidatus Saccharibacteria bacterium]